PPPPPPFDSDIDTSVYDPVLNDMKTTLKFVEAIQNASLKNTDVQPLPDWVYDQIRSPPTEQLTLDDQHDRLSVNVFLATSNAAGITYDAVRDAIIMCYPDSKMLTYSQVKRLVEKLSGVVEVMNDMCVDSCCAFTGPFRDLENCPFCGKERYKPQTAGRGSKTRKAWKQFPTILLAPQLQALHHSKESSYLKDYHVRCTEVIFEEYRVHSAKISPYKDFVDGEEYLNAVQDGKITPDDTVLMLSMDGAQLYRNKTSDCWLYIWLIMDLDVNARFKKDHVLPGGFIPGPNKPKHVDSFLFPGLYHLSALQNDGLSVWDAGKEKMIVDHPYLHLVTADGPGMALLSGFVGHHGRLHCRFYCPIVGRHKPEGAHYYPARLKPHDYPLETHEDIKLIDLFSNFDYKKSSSAYLQNLQTVINSPNKTQYEQNRLQTGICKPSIFLGLSQKHMTPVPRLFGGDNMHLPSLNIPDLYIPLWRGTFSCDRTDNKDTWIWAVLKNPAEWKAHGKLVEAATHCIPGSFDRPPRNPAEKISSGYKAWEFLL
ncbi:hypothetical protein FISHEDRAFT_18296, partial [Fistulina hepatica ATCC 64428]